jgi:quercetin dioxygenase-like cupin family protein
LLADPRVRNANSKTGGLMMRRRYLVPAILMLAVIAAIRVQAQEHPHTVAMPESLQWVEPATLPGARLAVVQGDPGKEGLFVYRLKMPAGYRIPPHLHKASENVTVLSGVFFIGMGEKFDQSAGQAIPAGGYFFMPAGMKHFVWTTGETVIQTSGANPSGINYLDPADDPRNAKK